MFFGIQGISHTDGAWNLIKMMKRREVYQYGVVEECDRGINGRQEIG